MRYNPKRSKTRLAWLALPAALVLAWLLYQLPPIHDRLFWRVELARTYLRGVIHPAGAVPTPLPQPSATPGPAYTATPTLSPTMPLPPTPTSSTPQPSPTPLSSPTAIPQAVQLASPDYEKQEINNCGPASLAMYLNYYGWDGDQNTIASLIKPIPEDRNVNVDELVYYVRTQAGWLNAEFRVDGDITQLKQLIAAGIPVMIEESFHFTEAFWPNDDLWAAHYLLLTGYDDAKQSFTGQDSFYGPDQPVSYAKLDAEWKIFNRVYILVYPPNQQAAVQAILGPDWDVNANRQNALDTARTESKANPQDAFAWFNLGSNLVFFERYDEAATAYDQARTLGLPQRMLRYQFGPFFAYFNAGRTDDLLALTEYALQRTPNAEEALLWHGWALYRKGDVTRAVEEFRKALAANANYLDAKYALDFVGSTP